MGGDSVQTVVDVKARPAAGFPCRRKRHRRCVDFRSLWPSRRPSALPHTPHMALRSQQHSRVPEFTERADPSVWQRGHVSLAMAEVGRPRGLWSFCVSQQDSLWSWGLRLSLDWERTSWGPGPGLDRSQGTPGVRYTGVPLGAPFTVVTAGRVTGSV